MPEIRISDHAREQMAERGISEGMVLSIIAASQQTIPLDTDKVVYQSLQYFEEEAKEYLVRVFVNIIKVPNLVITVYRTSKVEKYWKYES